MKIKDKRIGEVMIGTEMYDVDVVVEDARFGAQTMCNGALRLRQSGRTQQLIELINVSGRGLARGLWCPPSRL